MGTVKRWTIDRGLSCNDLNANACFMAECPHGAYVLFSDLSQQLVTDVMAESNCDKLAVARKTRREWQQRAEKAEAALTAAEQRVKEVEESHQRICEIKLEIHEALIVAEQRAKELEEALQGAKWELKRLEGAWWGGAITRPCQETIRIVDAALAQPRTEDKIADAMLDNLRASGKAREENTQPRTGSQTE